jgi:hypothetical protein
MHVIYAVCYLHYHCHLVMQRPRLMCIARCVLCRVMCAGVPSGGPRAAARHCDQWEGAGARL